MEASIRAVENIVRYQFNNKKLLEEALTHSSYSESRSYERLEFVGDSVLSSAFSCYIYHTYPNLDPGHLSLIRSANVNTEKLARVAIRHGFYQYLRHNVRMFDEKVREFTLAIQHEQQPVTYAGLVKAPKFLADIVESIAAAIFVDCGFNLQALWVIFRSLLEPIATLENLLEHPQPVTKLYDLCSKEGYQVNIQQWRNESKSIASIFVDGEFVVSSCTESQGTAKIVAAKEALLKLEKSKMGICVISEDYNSMDEIEGAKHKLHELCLKKRWCKPVYKLENQDGPSRDQKYIFSVSVEVSSTMGTAFIMGDFKSRIKEAENSAASNMIKGLQQYL